MSDELVPIDNPDPLDFHLLQRIERVGGISISQYRGPLMPGQEFATYVAACPAAGPKIFELSENISARTHTERMDDNRTARHVFRGFITLRFGYLAAFAVLVAFLFAYGHTLQSMITGLAAAAIEMIREFVIFREPRRADNNLGNDGHE